MKYPTISIALSFLIFSAFSQSCLPEGIAFSTQNQIDNFQSNYPGCTVIEGDALIEGNNITNLYGLNVLTSFNGNLIIRNNDVLASLSGFEGLTTIGGDLKIVGNGSLTNLTGLESLGSINGSLLIGSMNNGNNLLSSLTGLENVSSIGGDLYIRDNHALINLTGLDNVSAIAGKLIIWHNDALTSLSGLEALNSIVGNLKISNNAALNNLSGLTNLSANSIENMYIHDNPSLSSCAVQPICDYLSSPDGVVEIFKNAPGCNSPADIADICGFTMPCLPYGNYFFFNQVDVDSFQVYYLECSDLAGNVTINGIGINNLSGLSVLTSIGGNLVIGGQQTYNTATSLVHLNGLENLHTIGGDLQLSKNDLLESMSGLENLDSIGGSLLIGTFFHFFYATCYGNSSLASISALQKLNYIGENLQIVSAYMLTDLSGLENITSIPGEVRIGYNGDWDHCPNISLISLNGLNNLENIGEDLIISCDYNLDDLSALNNLDSVGGNLSLDWTSITTLSGFGSLSYLGGSLGIYVNDELSSLTGLDNLTSIGGNLGIGTNPELTDLSGLEQITSIDGSLNIGDNDNLTTLSGIDNIDPGTIGDLTIYHNDVLSDCAVLSICDYLSDPGGWVEIHHNILWCNSPEQVEFACEGSSIDDMLLSRELDIYPNPSSGVFSLRYSILKTRDLKIELYSMQGVKLQVLMDKVQPAGDYETSFDLSSLTPGMYLLVLQTDNGRYVEKVVKY